MSGHVQVHYKVLIIGGGTGGIITASLLRRAGQDGVAILEPSEYHFYQPIWTLVGAGEIRKESSRRREVRYIPQGVDWIQEAALEILPEKRSVTTTAGTSLTYDILVVAAGIQLNWNAIPGLKEAVDRGSASTNYAYDLAPRTWDLIRNFKGGTALFHMPAGQVKCPGAPQKIMYMAADYFRRKGILANSHVIFGSAGASIFKTPEYAGPLNQVLDRYKIDTRFKYELVKILPEEREAIFKHRDTDEETVAIHYDMLHAVPPQSAPDFIRSSPLADPKSKDGWVEVDRFTLQHLRYPNVFALGDVAGTPNSKTGAAASKQAPVVAANVLATLRQEEPVAYYNGYIACPIVTGYRRMLLVELDYSGRPSPSIPIIDTFRERYDMWLLKKYGLPWLYWNVLLRGRRIPFVARHKAVGQLQAAQA